MTNGPTYHSDDELIRRLQTVLRDATAGAAPTLDETGRNEARSLAAELAGRVFAEPGKWSIASIPPELRDDAAADAFVAMLFNVPQLGGRQSVVEWFSITAESRFRRLWTLSERQAAERERLAAEPALPAPAPAATVDEPEAAPSLFSMKGGVWERFDHDFPRDAFALRLRYLLKRSPEEMTVMLDAPSTRAIGLRVNRARDRFRMYCEQAGLSRRESADLMVQLAEEPSS